MEYEFKDIEEIIGFTTWTKERKIDELFRIDSYMYTSLGIDSLKSEREAVKKKSRTIYRAIQKIDQEIGRQLLSNADN
jgi:hypothetical protein